MNKEVTLTCGCGSTKKTVAWLDIPNKCEVCGLQVHVSASLSRLMGAPAAKAEEPVKEEVKAEAAVEVDTVEEAPVE